MSLVSRREFFKVATLAGAAGATAAMPAPAVAEREPSEAGSTSSRALTIAGYNSVRLRALAGGKVTIPGWEHTFDEGSISDLNTDTFSGNQTYDVTEIGIHPYMLAFANDGFQDYSLLPIFLLRVFRHKSIFIRNDRGIKRPQDLKGKRVATAGYSSSSLTWIRGILQDEYGVKPTDLKWVISQKDSAADTSGTVSKQESLLPDGVDITMGPVGKDESDLIEEGLVDATFHAAEPRCFVQGNSRIVRLFPDSRATEQDFFAKTGVFPIMHAVAIRRSLVTQHPNLPKLIFDAYAKSKAMHEAYMVKIGWAMESLPWFTQELEQTKALMGDNYYSYGVPPNRKALDTIFRYSHEQGLCNRRLTIEEIFEPSSLTFEEG